MQPIRILVTGGTFDKEYNELTGELFFQRHAHPATCSRLGRCLLDVEIETLMMIDSLQMTDADRELILDSLPAGRRAAAHRDHARHGHDGADGGGAGKAALPGKTIVLTGAMVPYTFGSSDGLFNLGTAMAFVQTLPAGVYVAMNGRCFPWDRVRKNKKAGVFEIRETLSAGNLSGSLSSILKHVISLSYGEILSLSHDVC